MSLAEMKRGAIPLHVEVAELLRRQIFAGTLKPGDQLPALSELTEQFGVARMTVRHAMDALNDEGLIQRQAGKGTFVRDVQLPTRHKLNMKAELAQLQTMVAELEVSVLGDGAGSVITDAEGREFLEMKRIHSQDGEPFCRVDILLENRVYQMAPARFDGEIVVTVLKDLAVSVNSARQRVTISYADLETAEALNIPLNSPVFRVFREFFCASDKLIYSATLIYPGDRMEFNIEFAV